MLLFHLHHQHISYKLNHHWKKKVCVYLLIKSFNCFQCRALSQLESHIRSWSVDKALCKTVYKDISNPFISAYNHSLLDAHAKWWCWNQNTATLLRREVVIPYTVGSHSLYIFPPEGISSSKMSPEGMPKLLTVWLRQQADQFSN